MLTYAGCQEFYHARLAKFFRDKELNKNVPRSSWAGRLSLSPSATSV
jgi:hypothetical protein